MLRAARSTPPRVGEEAGIKGRAFVLARGHDPVDAQLTDGEWDLVAPVAQGRRWPQGQCFSNSWRFLAERVRDVDLEAAGFRYVEGYVAADSDLLIRHAWVELSGKVVDLTLRMPYRKRQRRALRDRVAGELLGASYLGIAFPLRIVGEQVLERRMFDSIIDDWRRDWPLLQRFSPECRALIRQRRADRER